jgi:hypothetical protein
MGLQEVREMEPAPFVMERWYLLLQYVGIQGTILRPSRPPHNRDCRISDWR